MKKVCSKCSKPKGLEEFGRDAKARDGSKPHCKICAREYSRQWRAKNREKHRAYSRQYREDHLEKVVERGKRWAKENKDRRLSSYKKWREANPERNKKHKRDWVRRNPDKVRDTGNRQYHRKKDCPKFKMSRAFRQQLRRMLRCAGVDKVGRTHEQLGYSLDQFRERIEYQFQPGMTWSNHGKWHIDHKIPVSHFLAKGEVRPHIVNALCNLQPLWASDNQVKKDRHPFKG